MNVAKMRGANHRHWNGRRPGTCFCDAVMTQSMISMGMPSYPERVIPGRWVCPNEGDGRHEVLLSRGRPTRLGHPSI